MTMEKVFTGRDKLQSDGVQGSQPSCGATPTPACDRAASFRGGRDTIIYHERRRTEFWRAKANQYEAATRNAQQQCSEWENLATSSVDELAEATVEIVELKERLEREASAGSCNEEIAKLRAEVGEMKAELKRAEGRIAGRDYTISNLTRSKEQLAAELRTCRGWIDLLKSEFFRRGETVAFNLDPKPGEMRVIFSKADNSRLTGNPEDTNFETPRLIAPWEHKVKSLMSLVGTGLKSVWNERERDRITELVTEVDTQMAAYCRRVIKERS